jgi:hypothetical protein
VGGGHFKSIDPGSLALAAWVFIFLRFDKINVLVDFFADANVDAPALVALINGIIVGCK